MKTASLISRKTPFAFLVIVVIIFQGCQVLKGRNAVTTAAIPFDEKNARRNIILADTIDKYIKSFEDLRESSRKQPIQLDSAFPVSEYFNRDAIIAILNAPNAEYIRIYLGRRPKDNQIVFCLYPVDAARKDIKVQLLNDSLNLSNRLPATNKTRSLLTTSKAQGGEDGQRP